MTDCRPYPLKLVLIAIEKERDLLSLFWIFPPLEEKASGTVRWAVDSCV